MNAYQRAVKEITDERRADLDAGLAVWREALHTNKELREAYKIYQDEAVKKAQKQQNSIEIARKNLKNAVFAAKLDRNVIEPPCRCKLCNDTGIINGKYCKCVIKRVINSESENLVLPQTDFTEAQKTAPKAISKVYGAARKYIDEYQSGAKPFFIIAGSSGTGKTVLASAIATEFMKNGASAVTVSAFDFVKRAKDYHTQFAIDNYNDLFTPMLDCDVLVIDDLGTETMLKNITREYLYTVINERWLRKKHTVVTTNLKPEALIDRYGEAIFSRLCDKSVANSFMVIAQNARIK
ncbi:ATP-binding protein [Anaerocaecibacter muris]|uniref:ATP-binding protein n=1 Tax=Anaerocaecibacter muris TaxID=2941513 RepID=UPI003F692892